MKTFTVTVTETLERELQVTAENSQAAFDQVTASHRDGDLVLDSEDFTDCNIVVDEEE